VLVTFDEFCESGALYKWIDRRCQDLKLFQQENVAPLTLLSIDEYEGLLGLASHGTSPISVLERKVAGEWRLARMDTLLYEIGNRATLRLEEQAARFFAVTEACKARLFRAPAAEPCGA